MNEPHLDFSVLVLSMSQTALVHLGETPDPDGESHPADLSLARQTIDLLGILHEKTKGNLTGAEEHLLDQVLFDLRNKFVEASKASKA